MTTINSTILKHHRKTDGTYNVKICLRHKGNNAFINTQHFVDESSLTKDLKILNKTINTSVERTVIGYRKAIEKLGRRTKFLEIKELKKYLIDIDRHVDFIDFCRLHINDLKQKNKPRSASNYTTIVNSLIDFFGTEVVAIEEFNLRCLIDYERFLRSERILVRKNQFGKDVKTKSQGLSDAGVHNYMRDFKGLFSAARKYYNNPYLGSMLIPYDPFEDYTIIEPPQTRKRSLSVEQLKTIRDCKVKSGSRAELARDLFMLSFYLCGMNAVDIYSREYIIENGRIDYNRSKTKIKRKDQAFISIKVTGEAAPLLLKYETLWAERYKKINYLNAALSVGMREFLK